MDVISVFAIAFALAVDAFAVAVATGCCLPQVTRRHAFRLAWHFGLFQTGMTVLGWLGGMAVRSLIEGFDHWLAFGLLVFVSVRMFMEAHQPADCETDRPDPTRGWSLVLLSVATSIDALAVGLSLSLLDISIWLPALPCRRGSATTSRATQSRLGGSSGLSYSVR